MAWSFAYRLGDPEGILVDLMILQMQLLFDIDAQVFAHTAVLVIQLITNIFKLFATPREIDVQIRTKDAGVTRVVQVDCFFHHVAVWT